MNPMSMDPISKTLTSVTKLRLHLYLTFLGVVEHSFDKHSAADPMLVGSALPDTSFDFATTHEDRNIAKMTHVCNPHNWTWA